MNIIVLFVHMKGWNKSSVWYCKWERFLIKLLIGFSTSSFVDIWKFSEVSSKLPFR